MYEVGSPKPARPSIEIKVRKYSVQERPTRRIPRFHKRKQGSSWRAAIAVGIFAVGVTVAGLLASYFPSQPETPEPATAVEYNLADAKH